MELDHKEMVQWAAGDLAGAIVHLYQQRKILPPHKRFTKNAGRRYRRVPVRISRFTAAGVVELPADADGALVSVESDASRNKKRSIFLEGFS